MSQRIDSVSTLGETAPATATREAGQVRVRVAVRWVVVIAVVLVAAALRWRAVQLLPIDYDEDDYLRAGQQYAVGIQQGDWGVFMRENYRTEHPPLHKIAYGLAIVGLPPVAEIPDRPTTADPARTLPQPHLTYARAASALFGTLAVAALALLNPLAGLLLGIHTWSIKYTSQVMLEALPSLTSLLTVLFYLRSEGKRRGWLALSALAFGLTAASKYPYCLAAVTVAAHWLWRTFPRDDRLHLQRLARWLGPVVAWAALAVLVFFLADPYLWPDPINRLRDSLLYHGGYAQSEAVRRAGFPAWQPLAWLMMSVPWHPNVLVIALDMVIALFALLGLRRAWERQPLFVLWFGGVLIFLLVWSTKWPQYILMLAAPLSVLAAYGLQASVWEPLIRAWAQRGQRRSVPVDRRETLRALPWLLPGAAMLIVLALFPLLYQVAVALTDFNSLSILDGINGGVWREVWQGLTGQVQPVTIADPFAGGVRAREVNYVGPGLLLSVLGDGAGLLAFEAIWTVVVVAGQIALGVLVALMLHRSGLRFRGAWRALFILPVALPEFVGALAWGHLAHPSYGWVSLAVGRPLEWVRSSEQSLLVLAIAAVWMGWPLLWLAASAGLQLIVPEVYEAAAMDGAGAWRTFWAITWPMLLPLLAPAIILRAILAFNQFYLFYVFGYLTNGEIPIISLSMLSFLYFSPTFGGSFAISAAINVLIVVALIVFIILFNRWSRAGEGVAYA